VLEFERITQRQRNTRYGRMPKSSSGIDKRVAEKRLTIVTPPRVSPACISFERSNRQPGCKGGGTITKSQMPG
jgi:hypothetical protein